MKLTDYIIENDNKFVVIIAADFKHIKFIHDSILNKIYNKKLDGKVIADTKFKIIFENGSIIKIISGTTVQMLCSLRGCSIDKILVSTYAINTYNPEILYQLKPSMRKYDGVHFYEP